MFSEAKASSHYTCNSDTFPAAPGPYRWPSPSSAKPLDSSYSRSRSSNDPHGAVHQQQTALVPTKGHSPYHCYQMYYPQQQQQQQLVMNRTHQQQAAIAKGALPSVRMFDPFASEPAPAAPVPPPVLSRPSQLDHFQQQQQALLVRSSSMSLQCDSAGRHSASPSTLRAPHCQPQQPPHANKHDGDLVGLFSSVIKSPAPPPTNTGKAPITEPDATKHSYQDALSVVPNSTLDTTESQLSRRSSRPHNDHRDTINHRQASSHHDGFTEQASPTLTVALSPIDDPTFAPPPPTNSTKAEVSRDLARQAYDIPHDAAPLPKISQVRHSGYVLSRISFRTIFLKMWKQTFWIMFGPSTVLFFRTSEDYEDWVSNPYLTLAEREYLIKLRVDFVGDLMRINMMRYQVTNVQLKAYGGQMMSQFKLKRWMDYGPATVAAFASPDEKEVNDLRILLLELMKRSLQDAPLFENVVMSYPDDRTVGSGRRRHTYANASSLHTRPRHSY